MVRMAVVPVRHRDRPWTRAPYQADHIQDLLIAARDAAVRPAEILAPLGAQDCPRRFRFCLTLVRRAIRSEFTSRQVAQADAKAERHMERDVPPKPDLDIVGVGTEYEEIDRGHLNP